MTIFFKRKLSFLILRSGKFGNLVASFFWDYLENPLRYVSVPGGKKVSTHGKKTFDEVFFWIPRFDKGGVKENLCFSIIWIIWWPRRDKLILPGEKVITHDKKTFVGFCFDPMVITGAGWESIYFPEYYWITFVLPNLSPSKHSSMFNVHSTSNWWLSMMLALKFKVSII